MSVAPLTNRLVVFLGDPAAAPGLDQDVRRIFAVEWRRDLRNLKALAPDALVLVEVGAALAPDLASCGDLPTVAVVSPSRIKEQARTGWGSRELLVFGQDEDRLPAVLQELLAPPLLTERGREALERLPPLIRRSLVMILERPAPALVDAVEAVAAGARPFARTRRQFASRFGCSPDHLTRVARRVGLQWAEVHRHAVYLRLRHHRLVTGEGWGKTFMRFGVPTASSGTGFVKRVTGGMAPLAAERIPFEDVRDEFFEWLKAPGERGAGPQHAA